MQMESKLFIAGNAGPDVRSDCQITLSLKNEGGLSIDLVSRVKALYGNSILHQVNEMAGFYGLKNASIGIDDSGALPFVLAARLEYAIRAAIGSDREYPPQIIPEAQSITQRDRFRFTRLYLPGNTPKLMINAGIHEPDGIILDLEDSVAPAKKGEARILVRNALCQVNFYQAERMVRINQIPEGLEDLQWIIPYNVHLILIPKCESANQIKLLEETIERLCTKHQVKNRPFLMPIIESAQGVERAFEIAGASLNIVAMAIGLEDLTADLGIMRTRGGEETLWARQRIITACKAAGIQPIDSVFSDVGDMDGLLANVKQAKAIGFEGMGCIHPRQIPVIKEGFLPTTDEIEKASKIVEAFHEAEQKGLGVVSLGSKMIDPPVVKRALKTISLARSFGLLT
jgi:citrate lyase subunit beta/citryl-CoA lyase